MDLHEARQFTVPPQAMGLNFHPDGFRGWAVRLDSFDGIPEVFSAIDRQRVDAGKLDGADPQLLADLRVLGYSTYTREVMGKPLYTIISQDRDVSLASYRFDPSVRQSLLEQGFRLDRTEIGEATRFSFGGQWGESQGVVRIEHTDSPLIISTNKDVLPSLFARTYWTRIQDIREPERKAEAVASAEKGILDQEILVDTAKALLGETVAVKYERIPIAVLKKSDASSGDVVVRYFPDGQVAVDEEGQRLPIENADKRERHVLPWKQFFAFME